MKEWQEEYQRKQLSAEEAAKFVKSGDLIAFTPGREAHAIGLAIAARKEELRGVRVIAPTPSHDFGWYDPGWQESFTIVGGMITPLWLEAWEARRCEMGPGGLIPFQISTEDRVPDVLLTEVSPPDDNGFCSFGQSVWNKRRQIKEAKLVIAEVNNKLIRTYGDNYVHVSEIDYFVEHLSSGREYKMGSMTGKYVAEPPAYLKDITGYVSGLIKDRDTIQIGVGRTTEPMVQLGLLDNKHDLGYHSEATPPGIISLVREGVINGKYKTLHPDKVVVTSIGGSSQEEIDWVNMNPIFLLLDCEYVEDPRIIAANDNMVALNNTLAVDLSGQSNAETIGTRIVGGTGGQLDFVLGALLSKGGRSITVLPSMATVQGNAVSRIVPTFPEGSAVTVPRVCADYVVTEYGVAYLRGKTFKKRAEELIAIAHPDFRSELRKEAKKLYWP